MSRTAITRKSVLVTIALGLAGLGSTTMPAAAFSPFIHASSITPQVFPHQGGSIGSQVIGSPIQKPQLPAAPTTGAASQKLGSPYQKGPVPMSGSASSSSIISQTIGNNQQVKVPMPAPSSPGPIASQTIGSQPLKVPMPTSNPSLPPVPPIPHCEALPGCRPYPPIPNGGPNVSINVPPVVIERPAVIERQPVVIAQQPVPVPSQAPVTQAPAAAGEPCNCLTKQYLNDGSVLFRDVCSREAAIASPADLKAQAQTTANQ